jgi:tetratricopeptide (TPR) repeat protein
MKKTKRPFIAMVLMMCIHILTAQNSAIDSLKHHLETTHGEEHINTLNELGIAFWHIDPRQAVSYGKRAIAMARDEKLFTYFARAHNVVGAGYYWKGNIDSALYYYDKAKNIVMTLEKNPRQFTDLNNCARNLWSVKFEIGDTVGAFQEYEECINFIKEKMTIKEFVEASIFRAGYYNHYGFSREAIAIISEILKDHKSNISDYLIISSLIELGVSYYTLGDYNGSLNNFLQADSILKDKNGMEQLQLKVKNNLAGIYFENAQYEKTIELYKKVAKQSEFSENVQELSLSFLNLGSTYQKLFKFDSALFYSKKALKIIESHKELLSYEAYVNFNIGESYRKIGDYDNAVKHYNKALDILTRIPNPYYNSQTLSALAALNIQFENYSVADSLIGICFDILKQNPMPHPLKEAYHVKYLYDSATANYHEALKSHIRYTKVKDSLLTQEKQKHINRLQAKYELKEKEQQIRIQNQEIENKNATIKRYLLAIISSIIVVIFFVVFLVISRKQQLLRKNLEIQNYKLSILSGQINEHFVSNSIARIYSLLEMEKADEAKSYAHAFQRFLRYYIQGLDQKHSSLHNELTMVETYIGIQNLHDRNIVLKLPNTSNFDANQIKTPHFLLQPVVENAIIHGFTNLDDRKGEIIIELKKEAHFFVIIIKDNGKGINEITSHKNKFESIGLTNIEKRLKLLNKKNKIAIQSSEKGTTVIMTLYQKDLPS